ncbi:MAG: macro domain-containing protein [Candidatus Omnitrophota bacterium]|nr:macro domain-containing protein [Candidatus Omnitrophota bacterium]MDZ4241905.1 macro domain-containing protein [Candidatus Omnitrophota bacterium]
MRIKNIELKVLKGDITDLDVDAIVNPANCDLTMSAGLAGVIKKKGGDSIEATALLKGPVKPGQAVWTGGGELKAQYVIHAATVNRNLKSDEQTVRQATAGALKCAAELGVRSVALPALGIGTGGFPAIGAAKIMAQEFLKFGRFAKSSLQEIVLCLYDLETFEVFDQQVNGYVRHIQEDLGIGPYVTVDIIIELAEGIILIERSNPPYGWALPGGFVDYGESMEKAAAREAKEETNMDLAGLRQFRVYSDPSRDPRFHTVSTVFIAKGKGKPQFGDDAKGLKIVPYRDLRRLKYAFDHNKVIADYLKERKPRAAKKK